MNEGTPATALRIVYARVGDTPSQTVYSRVETRGDTRLGVTLIEEVLWADVPAEWQQAVLTNKLPAQFARP